MATTSSVPDVHNFELMRRRAVEAVSGEPHRAVAVSPSSAEWLKALQRAVTEGLIELQVIGDEKLFRQKSVEAGVSLDVPIIDINQPDQAVVTAAQMTVRGEANLIIKGRGDTVEFLKRILSREAGFTRPGRIVSHVAAIKAAAYPKLLLVADGGLVPEPDLVTKLAIIDNLAHLASAVGIDMPRVAVVCAVEAIYPQMKNTTEAAVLAKMSERGQIKGAIVDGPLSFDCAVDPEAAAAKGLSNSVVAGQADAIVAPTIETANGVYKALALYGNAESGGVLVGGRVPVALTNRWDSVDSRYHSILLALLASRR